MTTEQTNASEWRAIARRIVAGEFDSPKHGRTSRKGPDGSLRDSLIIGMRGQIGNKDIDAALEYLNHETK